jgi:2'-5' RNA ligase
VTRLARAFLAVGPSPPVLDALAARLEPLAAAGPGLRWAPRGQWHLTLQFLGTVGDAEALGDAVGSAVAALPPFTSRLAGAGAFPSARRAAVLWVGVDDPAPLATLAGAVQRATAELGHQPEERPYHPHLTVARAARPRSVAPLVEALEAPAIGPAWTVDEVALVASDTRPDGAVHTVWARRPLGA